jgi:hypothetical protein
MGGGGREWDFFGIWCFPLYCNLGLALMYGGVSCVQSVFFFFFKFSKQGEQLQYVCGGVLMSLGEVNPIGYKFKFLSHVAMTIYSCS